MKQIIEDLFGMDRNLLGAGFDSALKYIDHLIPLEVISWKSGTKIGTWTVPDEWIVHEAWVEYNGERIVDYTKNKLSLMVYSEPFMGTLTRDEFEKHLFTSHDNIDAYPYVFKFYERDWGVTLPKNRIYFFDDNGMIGAKLLGDGEYTVHINTEFRKGNMKAGVHTIPGKTDKEILLFAHLDHPYQANDNLSGVACLIDLVRHIKPKQYEHTIKLIFCPETIGSTAYALTQDISKVDFVIALDAVGNKSDEGIILQKSFDRDARINDCMHLALRNLDQSYRQAPFRATIGSDEYAFNDPQLGIPGIMLSTHPYREYHTSKDTPDIIDYEMIEKVQRSIIKAIEYYEKDYIPKREFKAQLFRSGYGIQQSNPQANTAWDYFFYAMGEKPISKLCTEYGIRFEDAYELLEAMVKDKRISRGPTARKGNIKTSARKKHAPVRRKTNAVLEPKEMP